ncbi:hypothetical protein J6590_064226 [Homalodisca vitripennis]|nr:hypothetical protein J6590_064226 [Homalodisca vitripennis]
MLDLRPMVTQTGTQRLYKKSCKASEGQEWKGTQRRHGTRGSETAEIDSSVGESRCFNAKQEID